MFKARDDKLVLLFFQELKHENIVSLLDFQVCLCSLLCSQKCLVIYGGGLKCFLGLEKIFTSGISHGSVLTFWEQFPASDWSGV